MAGLRFTLDLCLRVAGRLACLLGLHRRRVAPPGAGGFPFWPESRSYRCARPGCDWVEVEYDVHPGRPW